MCPQQCVLVYQGLFAHHWVSSAVLKYIVWKGKVEKESESLVRRKDHRVRTQENAITCHFSNPTRGFQNNNNNNIKTRPILSTYS